MPDDRTMREAELRMWIAELDSPDFRVRLIAGQKVCEMTGLSDLVRGLAPGGYLRPAPSWPAVDITPERCEVEGAERRVVCRVRTLVSGVPLTEEVRVAVPLAAGALEEALDRGRAALAGRLL